MSRVFHKFFRSEPRDDLSSRFFVAHATSKKFLSPIETILLAPPAKLLVSVSTLRMISDILADLTYNFAGEKGCEGLVELWKKVKMPQESDYVRFSRLFDRALAYPRTGRSSAY